MTLPVICSSGIDGEDEKSPVCALPAVALCIARNGLDEDYEHTYIAYAMCGEHLPVIQKEMQRLDPSGDLWTLRTVGEEITHES